jgi:hypothetical protein
MAFNVPCTILSWVAWKFCLSMICSNNDVEKFCWFCLICYDHMNLNYTIFVDFFSLCKKYWASNPCRW